MITQYNGLFPSGFPTKTLYAFPSFPTGATCSAHLGVTPIYTRSAAHITSHHVTSFLCPTSPSARCSQSHRSLTVTLISVSPLPHCHATLSLTAPSLSHTNSFYALIRKTPAVFPTCTYSTHWAAVQYHRCNTLNHTHDLHLLISTQATVIEHWPGVACMSLYCHVQITVLCRSR